MLPGVGGARAAPGKGVLDCGCTAPVLQDVLEPTPDEDVKAGAGTKAGLARPFLSSFLSFLQFWSQPAQQQQAQEQQASGRCRGPPAPLTLLTHAYVQVVVTMGPSCQDVQVLVKMLNAGVTCARVDLTCEWWG